MPEITLDTGEKKKVACGPCIRGHRSSKCQHKDRVLIEVRKPGRPLSACPHVPGSCSCERAVVYTVPKSSECPCPTTSSAINPAAAIAAARVSKPKIRRSISSSVTPSTVQRAMDGDPSILAQQANCLDAFSQISSEPSSNVPSLVSSSSSTPQIDAADAGVTQRNDSVQRVGNIEIKDEERPRPHLGMMDIGGYSAQDVVVWGGEWPEINAQNPLRGNEIAEEPIASCCRPAAITEAPVTTSPPSSCCAPKAEEAFIAPGQVRQPPLIRTRTQIPAGMPNNSTFNDPNMNFGVNFAEPFSPTDARYGQLPNYDFFTQFEGRHGCGTNGQISSHINGNVEQHDCQCGDSCLCLGCSQHPANKTTTEYVRYHNELASRRYNAQHSHGPFPGFSQPPYVQAPLQYDEQMHSRSISNLQQNHYVPHFQAGFNSQQGYGLPPHIASSIQMLAPTNELQQFHIHPLMAPLTLASNGDFQFQNGFESSHGPPVHQDRPDPQRPPSSLSSVAIPAGLDSEAALNYDSPSTDQDDNASTLSPSSFYVQHFNVPGCDDVTGTCHCGDGCTCVGCLVHSGHDNEAAAETSAETTRRLTEALENNTLTQTQDLHGFNLDGFHGGIHESLLPTIVPG